jgi:hypothetical protein
VGDFGSTLMGIWEFEDYSRPVLVCFGDYKGLHYISFDFGHISIDPDVLVTALPILMPEFYILHPLLNIILKLLTLVARLSLSVSRSLP